MRHTTNDLMLLICWLFFFGSSTIATAQSVEREIVTNTVDFDGIQIADLTPSFKTGVNVVSLNITVTDDTAGFVTDLKQEDLLVYEDGVLQKTTYFSRRQLPIALALLMDTSASMDERMETAQEAAIGFSRRLRPDDLAEIIDFDSRVDILQPFTNSLDKLEGAIRQTSAGGSTSLYNALYISLKELKKAPLRVEDVRREAIVVLSDGEDTSSLVTFEEVLDIAKRSETAIYSIGINTDDGSTSFREADFVLRQLAQETGGRAFFPDDTENLAGIYEQISDELSSQYSVGYVSANPLRDGRWRRIVVRTNREKIATRTKQGYFGPTSN
jgi:Ca-activated chloride channel family protein